ncbi:MAG: TIGR02117 family protein [Methylacidiphilales bacterium]|nr:TIGR02117 family protein [Candidatus Methylacidiphilales bacterium]
MDRKAKQNTGLLSKQLFKVAKFLTVPVISSLTLLTIVALIPRQIINYPKSKCHIKICVANTGIHTNIILPIKNNILDWHNYLSIQSIGIDNSSDYEYLSFGWGDRDFYLSTPNLVDFRLTTTFKALFLPTPSVMYIKGYQSLPTDNGVKCIKLNEQDYLRLAGFIQAAFETDKNGEVIRIANGHTENAGFYKAIGSYSILRNCNSWTGEALRQANINTPIWDGLSVAIMFHLRNSCE